MPPAHQSPIAGERAYRILCIDLGPLTADISTDLVPYVFKREQRIRCLPLDEPGRLRSADEGARQ
jgi:hypothetical protein